MSNGMGDLGDLFGAVDGFVEDGVEFLVLGGTAVASNIAFTAGVNFALNKFWPTAPEAVKKYGVPVAAIGLGVGLGGYVASNFNRRVGMGIGIGLMSAGIIMGVRQFAPTLPLAGLDGLGYGQDEALLGLGETDLYARYLGTAPTTIESVAGLGYATTVEETSTPLNGLNNIMVEQVGGFGGYGGFGSAGVAATFS